MSKLIYLSLFLASMSFGAYIMSSYTFKMMNKECSSVCSTSASSFEFSQMFLIWKTHYICDCLMPAEKTPDANVPKQP